MFIIDGTLEESSLMNLCGIVGYEELILLLSLLLQIGVYYGDLVLCYLFSKSLYVQKMEACLFVSIDGTSGINILLLDDKTLVVFTIQESLKEGT